jgi:poly(3-hydroxybutyrate) depolymerase
MIPLEYKIVHSNGAVMTTPIPFRTRLCLSIGILLIPFAAWSATSAPLPALNIDLAQTTVSGISSGAFMAVQFGVAHSTSVRGIAATAGGPYFCAGNDSWAGAGVSKAIAHCMQGDPAYPATPITDADLANMTSSARAWGSQGLIDPVANLQNQRIWLFHGYNDGIVKKPVSDALKQWVSGLVPASQIFYKDELNAAHAQISAACGSDGASCQPCAQTGGEFINTCRNDQPTANAYDAAGAALQLFYGPLNRTASSALKSKAQVFDQRPYTVRDGSSISPYRISLADEGYLYVPADCAVGQSCRLHIAFHGCQQQAELIGQSFVSKAGFNEWADANRIVVLYPQAHASSLVPLPSVPYNPNGCWDWWGYNDFGWSMTGHFATKEGDQIASVWRMAQRLASAAGTPVIPATVATPQLQLVDLADDQVALTWRPVASASGYRVYRNNQPAGEVHDNQNLSWVDNGLSAGTVYTYRLRTLDAHGNETASSAVLTVQTGKTAPACDPYFSLAKNQVVTKNNQPTKAVCP